MHVLFHCLVYQSLRNDVIVKKNELNASFHTLGDIHKWICVVSDEQNTARFCLMILKARTNLL